MRARSARRPIVTQWPTTARDICSNDVADKALRGKLSALLTTHSHWSVHLPAVLSGEIRDKNGELISASRVLQVCNALPHALRAHVTPSDGDTRRCAWTAHHKLRTLNAF